MNLIARCGLSSLIYSTILLAASTVHADVLSTITIYAVDPSASESGPKAATFYIARNDGDFAKPLVVPLQLSGSATAGTDYVSLTSPVTFAPNVPLVTLKVMPIKDALKEGEETVTIMLVAKAGAYLLGEEENATATIADAGSASGPGAPGTTPSMPPLPPADRTGTLSVTIAFDGRGGPELLGAKERRIEFTPAQVLSYRVHDDGVHRARRHHGNVLGLAYGNLVVAGKACAEHHADVRCRLAQDQA